jgi:hypothetical protein
MNTTAGAIDESAQTASDASAFVHKAAHLSDGSNSTIGRVGAAASAVSLGARLLPAGMRLLKRNPVVGTLVIVGAAWVLFSLRGRSRRVDGEY